MGCFIALNAAWGRSVKSNGILPKRAEKFVIAPLYPLVTIAGHCAEPVDVQNGDAASANLNKPRFLKGTLH
jgi:hypothetical protein